MKHIRKLRAWVGGYFWVPCPVCRRMFGGFEVANGQGLMITETRGKGVCKKWVGLAEEINRRNFPDFWDKRKKEE